MCRLFTFLAAALAGYGVSLAILAVTAPAPTPPEVTPITRAADTAPGSVAPDTAPWPALFGEPVTETAPPPAAPETPEAPDIAQNYRLKGLVASGAGGWAIVSDGTSEDLLRRGDQVSGGETIVEITSEGVLIEGPGGRRLITFDPMDTPQSGASPEREDPDTAPPTPPRPETGPKPRALPTVALTPSDFAGQRLSNIITRAGGIANTALPDGTAAMEILWVRNGLLYDTLGLKKGDKIITINGQPITEVQNSAEVFGVLLQARKFTLELLRSGSRWTLDIEVRDAI